MGEKRLEQSALDSLLSSFLCISILRWDKNGQVLQKPGKLPKVAGKNKIGQWGFKFGEIM